jgi:hypothetical protein
MPDAPLLVDDCTWRRIERRFSASFEARDADIGQPVRLTMAMLIRARRERTCEIDTASVMSTHVSIAPETLASLADDLK